MPRGFSAGSFVVPGVDLSGMFERVSPAMPFFGVAGAKVGDLSVASGLVQELLQPGVSLDVVGRNGLSNDAHQVSSLVGVHVDSASGRITRSSILCSVFLSRVLGQRPRRFLHGGGFLERSAGPAIFMALGIVLSALFGWR